LKNTKRILVVEFYCHNNKTAKTLEANLLGEFDPKITDSMITDIVSLKKLTS
jgi:hypothetical protein